jgi:hypothetical protein
LGSVLQKLTHPPNNHIIPPVPKDLKNLRIDHVDSILVVDFGLFADWSVSPVMWLAYKIWQFGSQT